ncbi:hypothetical protein Rleg10DRAFT_5164 [Rhizobium leguminosarum bv. trifolii WSM2012]|nr:hypothetical protein Rleg10DRAFT_3806 [Rhizobium leguminosarum bv. trifolii WSM2012]EJC76492.1 hypothetical protein Rleg10DRAFT_5164 [Rhizobium leguminosarum bv. trifolii WSM2012]
MLPLSTRPNRSDRELIARANVDDALFRRYGRHFLPTLVSLAIGLFSVVGTQPLPSIHYAIFFAQNVNTTATYRTLARTLAVPEPLTRYFSVSGVKGFL